MPDVPERGGSYDRVAAELRACREAQIKSWGTIDNITLGRYLAGEATDQERLEVEAALEQHPELRQLTAVVRDVILDSVVIPSADEPAASPLLLPSRNSSPWRKAAWIAPLAIAACVLIGVGFTLLPTNTHSPKQAAPNEFAALTKEREAMPGARDAMPAPVATKGEAANDDDMTRQILLLHQQGKQADALALANRVAAAGAMQPEQQRRMAADLEKVALTYQNAGQLDRAEPTLQSALALRKNVAGPLAPETVQSMNQLAQVYQVALNSLPDSPLTEGWTTKKETKDKQESAKAASGATMLREKLTRQSPAQVKATVVPVLEQALRRSSSSTDRQAYARALGQLGPVARPTIPALADALRNAREPEERVAMVDALGEMAPTAGEAEPVLVQALKIPCEKTRLRAAEVLQEYGPGRGSLADHLTSNFQGKEDGTVRAMLKRAQQKTGLSGIRDEAELFSPAALGEARRLARYLAQRHAIEVYAETGKAAALEMDSAHRRAQEIGVNGLYLSLRDQPPGVVFIVRERLQRHGASAMLQSQLRQSINAALGNKDYDACLLFTMHFVLNVEIHREGQRTLQGAVGGMGVRMVAD